MTPAQKFLEQKMLDLKIYIPLSQIHIVAQLMDEWVALNEDVVKAISSNPDVSGNKAKQKSLKEAGEVAVAFADWCMEYIYEQENCKPTAELYENWKKAKATDR